MNMAIDFPSMSTPSTPTLAPALDPDLFRATCSLCGTIEIEPGPVPPYRPSVRYCRDEDCKEVLKTKCRICEEETNNLRAMVCTNCKGALRQVYFLKSRDRLDVFLSGVDVFLTEFRDR